jgi:Domain of unknown function (DUF1707)
MMAGPQDPAAAGRDRLRVGHADREQVIEALKAAFVHGRLTKAELDTRAGQALSARTYADLAALTADIPAAPSDPPAAAPARPSAPARRRPLARAAAWSGGCLVIAAAAAKIAFQLDPEPGPPAPYASWTKYLLLIALAAVFTAMGILVHGVGTSLEQRRSRRQPPPRPGGHALDGERRGGTGYRPVPPGPRPDQARADLRSDSSRPRRPHSSGRGARTPRGIRPVPDAG